MIFYLNLSHFIGRMNTSLWSDDNPFVDGLKDGADIDEFWNVMDTESDGIDLCDFTSGCFSWIFKDKNTCFVVFKNLLLSTKKHESFVELIREDNEGHRQWFLKLIIETGIKLDDLRAAAICILKYNVIEDIYVFGFKDLDTSFELLINAGKFHEFMDYFKGYPTALNAWLKFVAVNGRSQILLYLLDIGATDYMTAFVCAVTFNSQDVIDLLMSRYTNILDNSVVYYLHYCKRVNLGVEIKTLEKLVNLGFSDFAKVLHFIEFDKEISDNHFQAVAEFFQNKLEQPAAKRQKRK